MKLYAFQVIGFAAMFLFPVLALLGVFGRTTQSTMQSVDDVELTVTYSSRAHLHKHEMLNISVRNRSSDTLPIVTVALERAFLDNYTKLSFTPAPYEINGEAYEVMLLDIPPGGTQMITVSHEGRISGAHSGLITATVGSGSLSVPVDVFIFP
jgi:hypothetical protein